MSNMKRRDFFKKSGAVVAASQLAFAANAQPSKTVKHAVIGLGNQGSAHCQNFSANSDICQVVAVCDVDPERRDRAKNSLPNPSQVKTHEFYKEILENPDIDSVSIATPDHWHSKIAIEALLAGKHVYVEKPCSHNINEGELLAKVMQNRKQCLQHGTQRRSSSGIQKAIEFVHSGGLGKIRAAKCVNHQFRGPIGNAEVSQPPQGVNYDLWIGPAPEHPFTKNRWHYNWHWFWDYGTGDLGNDGVHFIDLALWGLNADWPNAVSASGGQLFYNDDHQTPDTQNITFEYDDYYLIYEMRLWTDYPLNEHHHVTSFYGDKGWLDIGRTCKATMVGGTTHTFNSSAPLKEHTRNFLQCIIDETPQKLRAPIDIAVPAAATCHIGNIATRVGQKLYFDSENKTFKNNDAANALLGRSYREGYEIPQV